MSVSHLGGNERTEWVGPPITDGARAEIFGDASAPP